MMEWHWFEISTVGKSNNKLEKLPSREDKSPPPIPYKVFKLNCGQWINVVGWQNASQGFTLGERGEKVRKKEKNIKE